jgi:hypothetical protein
VSGIEAPDVRRVLLPTQPNALAWRDTLPVILADSELEASARDKTGSHHFVPLITMPSNFHPFVSCHPVYSVVYSRGIHRKSPPPDLAINALTVAWPQEARPQIP